MISEIHQMTSVFCHLWILSNIVNKSCKHMYEHTLWEWQGLPWDSSVTCWPQEVKLTVLDLTSSSWLSVMTSYIQLLWRQLQLWKEVPGFSVCETVAACYHQGNGENFWATGLDRLHLFAHVCYCHVLERSLIV